MLFFLHVLSNLQKDIYFTAYHRLAHDCFLCLFGEEEHKNSDCVFICVYDKSFRKRQQGSLCQGPPARIHMWKMGTEFLVSPVSKHCKRRPCLIFQGIQTDVKLVFFFLKRSPKQTLRAEKNYMYSLFVPFMQTKRQASK